MVQLWAVAAERAFDLFAGWAAARDETYGLGTTVSAVRDTFRELLNGLDRVPVTVDGQTYDVLPGRGPGHAAPSDDGWADLEHRPVRFLARAKGTTHRDPRQPGRQRAPRAELTRRADPGRGRGEPAAAAIVGGRSSLWGWAKRQP